MKKIFAILALSAGLSQATVIHWSASNDSKSLADTKANDSIYTGYVDLIEFNDGSISSIWSTPDALLGKYVVMDTKTNMFYISNSNVPASVAANALLTASFNFDVNAGGTLTKITGLVAVGTLGRDGNSWKQIN